MQIQLVDNVLKAEDFVRLRRETGFADIPVEHAKKALANGLINVSAYCGDKLIGMGRLVGDGTMYWYLQEIIVLPEYQKKGIGRLLINEILQFINDHGVEETEIFVELCAMPDKIPFYEKFGFRANEAQRLRLFHKVRKGENDK